MTTSRNEPYLEFSKNRKQAGETLMKRETPTNFAVNQGQLTFI